MTQCNLTFAEDLWNGYRKLRGFWRHWFSVYIFSHCEIFELEKFCLSGPSTRGPGLPDRDPYVKDYFYRPRPATWNPPISPEEFRHVYHHYRHVSSLKINIRYRPVTAIARAPYYWPRIFKDLPPLFQRQIDSNFPTDTVPKVPPNDSSAWASSDALVCILLYLYVRNRRYDSGLAELNDAVDDISHDYQSVYSVVGNTEPRISGRKELKEVVEQSILLLEFGRVSIAA